MTKWKLFPSIPFKIRPCAEKVIKYDKDMRLVVEELLIQIYISAFRADFEKYSSGNHKEFLTFLFSSSSSSLRKNCENEGIKFALFVCHDVFMSPANAASLRHNNRIIDTR